MAAAFEPGLDHLLGGRLSCSHVLRNEAPWVTGGGRPRGNRTGPAALDELLRRGRQRLGGGGGLPDLGGRPIWLYAIGVFLLLWIIFTCFHRIGPQERGVILRLGSYAGTMSPGIGLSSTGVHAAR